jgi:subtilase family serine protease
LTLELTNPKGCPNWYFTIDGWMYEMAVIIFEMKTMPTVISVSYGWPEQDTCNPITNAQNCTASDTQAYIQRANTEFAKLGTAGVTVIVCTQDEGAPSEANEDCTNKKHPLWPTYPGSSPFVTAVGSQSFVPTPDHEFDEVEYNSLEYSVDPYQEPLCQYKAYPCTNNTYLMPCMVNNTHFSYTSGGGFSTWGPQQAYQSAQVAAYLKSSAFIPPKQFFNSNMRGFPDVVAAGEGILMILGGQVVLGGKGKGRKGKEREGKFRIFKIRLPLFQKSATQRINYNY